jgi:hypothetical protein
MCSRIRKIELTSQIPFYVQSVALSYNAPLGVLENGSYGDLDEVLSALSSSLQTITVECFHMFPFPNFNHFPILSSLIVGNYTFKDPVDDFSPSLTFLFVEYSAFDQSVNYLLPSLKHLSLSNDFNQPVDHFSTSLKTLKIGTNYYDHPIDHLLADFTKLQLRYYSQPMNYLSIFLKTLKVVRELLEPINHLLFLLSTLKIHFCEGPTPLLIDNLPLSLTQLEI